MKKIETETCERCFGTFVPANARQRFCCTECRVASHKERAAVARDPRWRSWPHTSRAIVLASDLTVADLIDGRTVEVDELPVKELRPLLWGALDVLGIALNGETADLRRAHFATGVLDEKTGN